MRLWTLTLFAAFAGWRARRDHKRADKWLKRAKWAEERLRKLRGQ